jgi:hypothetical protein
MSALDCSRVQSSAICKNAASGVVAVHNARASPLVRQPLYRHAPRPGPAPSPATGSEGQPARLRRASTNRASADRDAEHIVGELANPAAGDPMPGGQRHRRRVKSEPERRSANLRRQPALVLAWQCRWQLMGAMLGHDHADRRQLADLIATEPPRRTPPVVTPASATATRVRVVIDDLITWLSGSSSRPAPRCLG